MPKNAELTATTESLKTEVAQARARETELAGEASSLPERIKEASLQVVRDRAAQARAGGDLLAVAAEVDVQELRAREEIVGYELWASRLHRAELAARLGEVEEQAALFEIPDAEGKHRAAEAAVVAARASEQAAYTVKMRAYGRVEVARKAKNAARADIEELEAVYPGS